MASYLSTSERETERIGTELAERLVAGDVVLLSGGLGAGKTALVRGIAAGLGCDPSDVSSPTFTLVQEYGGGRLPLCHVDLYRLDRLESEDLGLGELSEEGSVVAIEWPERLAHPIERAIRIMIDVGTDDRRAVTVIRPPG